MIDAPHVQVVLLPLPLTLQRCNANWVSLLDLSSHARFTCLKTLFLPLPEYCAEAVRVEGAAGGAGGGVLTVRDAIVAVVPVFAPFAALASTWELPTGVELGVGSVNVAVGAGPPRPQGP